MKKFFTVTFGIVLLWAGIGIAHEGYRGITGADPRVPRPSRALILGSVLALCGGGLIAGVFFPYKHK